MAASAPDISVVIPSHQRETRLAFALDALASQTLSRDRFEVIVVRSSDAGSLTSAPEGLDARFMSSEAANISIQRNLGWRAARAPLIAFMDDDCRPTPEWLERMLAAWDGGEMIIQGRIAVDPDEQHHAWGIVRIVRVDQLDRWFQTGNIAYPRVLLERLGGFDEELAFHCEDSDFGLRAEAAGATPAFVGEAVVFHTVRVRTLRKAFAEAARFTGEPQLLARFPSQRELLYMRAFVHRDHPKLLLAVVGAVCWRRSRIAAALLAYPYAHVRIKRRLGGGARLSAWAIPRVILDIMLEGTLDAIEVTMRARSSLRYRQIVL